MLKIFTLTILALSASMAFGEDKPAVKSPTDILFEKVVAENTRDTIKTYDLYCKQLAEASARVAKSLEGIKADLNNTKKFTNLSITERADMMKAIDEKIKSVDEGAVGDGIVSAKVATQWLTNDVMKVLVGKWSIDCDITGWRAFITINEDGTALCSNGIAGTWKTEKATTTIQWNGIRDFVAVKIGKSGTMTGTEHNGNVVVMKLIPAK